MTPRNQHLQTDLEDLYRQYHDTLLFHDWNHVLFVSRKSLEFAEELGADKELVEAAALTHDLNYLIDVKSDVDAGRELRAGRLSSAGYIADEIAQVEGIVHSASIQNRDANISDAAKALADADSLFKVLPVGPLTLSARYIAETKVDLRQWADKIMRDQKPLLDEGIYFYTKTANEKYLDWARVNLALVETIQRSLDDPDIQAFLLAYGQQG